MKTRYNSLFMYTFLILLPMEFTPGGPDSSETTIKLVRGSGQYGIISRGCEGEVLEKEKIKFTEIGGQIDHKFSGSPVRIGVRGEYVSSKYPTYNMTEIENTFTINTFIINPFLNFEGRKVALGGGIIWSSNPLPDRAFGQLIPEVAFSLGMEICRKDTSAFPGFIRCRFLPMVSRNSVLVVVLPIR